jgi:ribosomal protein L31E
VNTQSTSTREYVESREYEICRNRSTNQVAQLHGVTFKKRAPRAIKEIKAFATKSMVRTGLETREKNCQKKGKLTVLF